MYYLLTSIILLVVYIILIILMSKVKKNKILNIIFPIIIFMCYIHSVYSIYKSVGFNDWNFQNTLPTANVSPFMFTLVFLNLLFPHQFKKYIYTLVSYLSFGMVVAGLITMIYNYIRDYNYYLNSYKHFELFY